ncbi:MAG: SDR family oxidoreductase [Planctomycetota bacterium]
MAEGRIAVLGGRGMLGTDLTSLCREQGREVTVLDLPEFDITKASDVGRSERPYVETDKPKAINSYGSTKLAGDRLLVASGCSHCIMRLEWTYGLNGSNFVTKLIERAKSGGPLRVVDDQRGSPTATTEAAKVICKLLAKKPEGLFHFASAGYVSRFDMARFILDRLGISVDLQSCKSSDYVTAAERPLNSCFDCSKIIEFLGEPIRPWQEPLEEFLRQL